MSDSLRPHESQHARPPCPSLAPGVHLNSCPSSRWCHPAIPSSAVPFSSCLQSLPASESFPMSQLFAWGGQRTGVSASALFPPEKSSAKVLCRYDEIREDYPGLSGWPNVGTKGSYNWKREAGESEWEKDVPMLLWWLWRKRKGPQA